MLQLKIKVFHKCQVIFNNNNNIPQMSNLLISNQVEDENYVNFFLKIIQ